MKAPITKTISKTILAIVTLIFILLAIGMAYIYYTDHLNVKRMPVTISDNSVEPTGVPKPSLPASNAQEGVSVASVTSPVSIGSNSTLAVRTNAGSTCTIMVSYNGIQSKDSGLLSKIADDYGSVSWTWTVDNSVPIGKWPIKVTCTYHGRSGVVIGELEVIK